MTCKSYPAILFVVKSREISRYFKGWEQYYKSPIIDEPTAFEHFVATVSSFTTLGELPTWWRHQMETFSVLLAICAGNSPVPGEFPTQRPVTRSFDVFFDLRLNKRLSKQSWGWWFETLLRPLWRHRNEKRFLEIVILFILCQRAQISRIMWVFKLISNTNRYTRWGMFKSCKNKVCSGSSKATDLNLANADD